MKITGNPIWRSRCYMIYIIYYYSFNIIYTISKEYTVIGTYIIRIYNIVTGQPGVVYSLHISAITYSLFSPRILLDFIQLFQLKFLYYSTALWANSFYIEFRRCPVTEEYPWTFIDQSVWERQPIRNYMNQHQSTGQMKAMKWKSKVFIIQIQFKSESME